MEINLKLDPILFGFVSVLLVGGVLALLHTIVCAWIFSHGLFGLRLSESGEKAILKVWEVGIMMLGILTFFGFLAVGGL